MKTMLNARTLLVGCLSVFVFASAHASSRDIVEAEEIHLYGIDYSRSQMIGILEGKGYDDIFPGFTAAWNSLLVKEQLDIIFKSLGKKDLAFDIDPTIAANASAPTEVIVRRGGRDRDLAPHISNGLILETLEGYRLKEASGLGMVFIMDALVENKKQACLHTVFFDIETRLPHGSFFGCYEASGFGFRNYWFHPVKEAIQEIKPQYKAWAKDR